MGRRRDGSTTSVGVEPAPGTTAWHVLTAIRAGAETTLEIAAYMPHLCHRQVAPHVSILLARRLVRRHGTKQVWMDRTNSGYYSFGIYKATQQEEQMKPSKLRLFEVTVRQPDPNSTDKDLSTVYVVAPRIDAALRAAQDYAAGEKDMEVVGCEVEDTPVIVAVDQT